MKTAGSNDAPSTDALAGGFHTRYVIVSQQPVSNPNLDADFVRAEDFCSGPDDLVLSSQVHYFVDVNSLDVAVLDKLQSSSQCNVSFFYTKASSIAESCADAVYWPALGPDEAKIFEGLNQGRSLAELVGATALPDPSATLPPVVRHVFVKRAPVVILVAISLIAGLYSSFFWGIPAIFDSNAALSSVFLAVLSVSDVVSLVGFFACVLLVVAREVFVLCFILKQMYGKISKTDVFRLVVRSVATIEVVLIVAAGILYVYLGGGVAERMPAVLLGNPFIMFFMNLFSAMEFLTVILPQRFIVGIVVPVVTYAVMIGTFLWMVLHKAPDFVIEDRYGNPILLGYRYGGPGGMVRWVDAVTEAKVGVWLK